MIAIDRRILRVLSHFHAAGLGRVRALRDTTPGMHASGQRARSRGVIVYLTQKQHSSYGRDSQSLLHESIRLLFENYNAAQLDDLWFFHTGDVPVHDQQHVLSLCQPARAEYVQLAPWHFQLPPGAQNPDIPLDVLQASRSAKHHWHLSHRLWTLPNRFSAGYRHMIRFFTIGIWEVLASAGYEYVMRMDEDSFIRTPVRYNLFDFMAKRDLVYTYRLGNWEADPHVSIRGKLHAFVRTFVKEYNLTERVERTGWLLEPCVEPRSVANYTIERCGLLNGPYSNWFMSKVSFWQEEEVASFLRYVNASHSIYFERFGDNLLQGIAYQIFANRSQVHQHHDFAYEHVTRKPVRVGSDNASIAMCMGYGGFALGINISKADSVAARSRLRQVIAEKARQDVLISTNHLFFARCPRIAPCFVGDQLRSNDAGMYIGSATAEQPMCGRHPQPYYCGRMRELPTSTNPQEVLNLREIQHQKRSCSKQGPKALSKLCGRAATESCRV